MKPKQDAKVEADKLVRDIQRATRRKFSAEEKIRIVLAGLRGEDSIAELCRREGLHQNLYYRWSKEFLDAGTKRLAGATEREASHDDVSALRKASGQLKTALAEMLLENRLLNKSVLGTGEGVLGDMRPPKSSRASAQSRTVPWGSLERWGTSPFPSRPCTTGTTGT